MIFAVSNFIKMSNTNTDLQTTRLFLNKSFPLKEIIFVTAAGLCFSSLISPPIALIMGLIVAQYIGHPFLHLNHKATHLLLQLSVLGLGFGMNVGNAYKAGKEGILFTVISIISTLAVGLILGRVFKIDKKTAYLISSGTAICGGSAIAAISPVIKAEEKQISVALGTIFILNSVALFLFPFIGGLLHLSQTQFGLWCALAIHDTSSVVGAASKYGNVALEVATTVKLARALWILPVAIISSFVFKNKNSKLKIPYFMLFFVVAMFINTYFPILRPINHAITTISKSGLTLTLFLIGSGLSKQVLLSVGIKPLLQGLILWLMISVFTLVIILQFS